MEANALKSLEKVNYILCLYYSTLKFAKILAILGGVNLFNVSIMHHNFLFLCNFLTIWYVQISLQATDESSPRVPLEELGVFPDPLPKSDEVTDFEMFVNNPENLRYVFFLSSFQLCNCCIIMSGLNP